MTNNMTLAEQISKIDPEVVVGLKTAKYGIVWIGKAKFVFNNVSLKAWYGTDLTVCIMGRQKKIKSQV